VTIRPETPEDFDSIRQINIAAFANHAYSQQTEHLIVEALRADGALTLSLVAEVEGLVVGHVAFSEAGIGELATGWFLLGPVAVLPSRQRQGIGSALIRAGLQELQDQGASGCVLVGDPAFYQRFGFRPVPGVTWPGVPGEYVQCLAWTDATPTGEVTCHPAFHVKA
jgi:putative acetyltransferase